jgi:malonate decarboxylase gamma subunit
MMSMISLTQATDCSRGRRWLALLTGGVPAVDDYPASVRVVDAPLMGQAARYIAVVPDPGSRFPRARAGEVGLVEGWQLARSVHQVIEADHGRACQRPIVAVIDVASQAYGRREEAYGIHQALAAAAGAYASARLAGHVVLGLIVGKAMSGAFLAHGYQANRLIAFDDPQVMVHAMGKASAARITLRSVEALEALAATVPPMAYDIESYAALGLLRQTVKLSEPDAPSDADVGLVVHALEAALTDVRTNRERGLESRLGGVHRHASRTVRELLQAQWNATLP